MDWASARELGDRTIPLIINTGYGSGVALKGVADADARVLKSGDLDPLKRSIRTVLEKAPRQNEVPVPAPLPQAIPARLRVRDHDHCHR